MLKISEIELNFANQCTADCTICASAHGEFRINPKNNLMTPDIFETTIKRLKEIDFDIIQTSGNGDAFLNPNFLDYLTVLRKEFPNKIIHNYSSFVSYTPQRADYIISNNLINKQHTRIDSLNLPLWKKIARMDVSSALENMTYFAKSKRNILFSVGYSNIKSYINKCRTILNKEPLKIELSDEELLNIQDEFESIRNYFERLNSQGAIEYTRINQSLWSEREDTATPIDTATPCPKLPILTNCLWVCPNGNVDLCGYDDTQREFMYGNIQENTIEELWNSEKRKQLIGMIESKSFRKYPCNNPKCCILYNQ